MEEIREVGKSAATSRADSHPKELAFYQKIVLRILAGLVGLWSRTFRFDWGKDVQSMMDREFPPCVVIFWHNRLLIAPEFYRRHFSERKLAVLISPSRDGAWIEGLTKLLGIMPIRGSRKGGRAVQAVRDLISTGKAGRDLAFTPDGSRGPMYEMKAGAVSVAMKIEAPILLLSFNCENAWRLNSWDRLFLPKPWSRINVQMNDVGPCSEMEMTEIKEISKHLKELLDAMNDDF
ncbi:MAG: DUF374 domain-containing protein [Verrucomicrobiota bacterium]